MVNPSSGIVLFSDGSGPVQNIPVDTVDMARLTGTVMAKDNLTVAVSGLIRTNENKNEGVGSTAELDSNHRPYIYVNF